MLMAKGRGVEVSKVFLVKLEVRLGACTFIGFWFVEHKRSLWSLYGNKM